MATPIPDNSAHFTLDEVLRVTGGHLVGTATAGEATGVVTDSRRVTPGQLFVALVGETHDAHRFLRQAGEQGAAIVVVSNATDVPFNLTAIEVLDTTRALGQLARLHRERWGKRVVAITGSAGKTTTKELTAAALTALGQRVHKTSGNLNNAIGVPMTLLQLEAAHDVAVVECGTSGPGEIAWLAELAQPDVAVVLEAAAAHTEGLGTVEAVAVEKASLLGGLGSHGVAVWNADNAELVKAVANFSVRQLRFGISEGVDVRLASHHSTPGARERCVFESGSSGNRCEVELGLLGIGAALDAAAVLAIVSALHGEKGWDAAAHGLSALRATPGRMCPQEAERGVVVLDDTYNANPISCERSLRAARELAEARGGRVIAVLGDMKELGAESALHHRRIGRLAVELKVAAFVGCGAEMAAACDAAMAEAARERLPSASRVMHVRDPLEAVAIVRAQLQDNDVVLIKGSRSMGMERVVEALAQKGRAA